MSRYPHASSEGDSAAVEVRDAATIMVVRNADDPNAQHLEVLMVQRASRAVFGPSAWVFPGGRVDDADGDRSSDSPWRRAAIRETLEESGLLVCAPAWSDGEHHPDQLSELRNAVRNGEIELFGELETRGVAPNLDDMYEVGRFTTPVGPPRRFDTWFYLTAAPAEQTATPDGEEVTHAVWVAPETAIERSRDGEFPLMSVTFRMLACLARYSDLDELIDVAKSMPPQRRVRVNDPKGDYDVLLPEDEGYEDAELEVEHGWVRL